MLYCQSQRAIPPLLRAVRGVEREASVNLRVRPSADYSVLVYLLARPYMGDTSAVVYTDGLFMAALALATIQEILSSVR